MASIAAPHGRTPKGAPVRRATYAPACGPSIPYDPKRRKRDARGHNLIQQTHPPQTQRNFSNVKRASQDRDQAPHEPPTKPIRANLPPIAVDLALPNPGLSSSPAFVHGAWASRAQTASSCPDATASAAETEERCHLCLLPVRAPRRRGIRRHALVNIGATRWSP